MKYTLLDLTQTILSSMDSDAVNSISDSIESLQVAKIIRTVYYDIVNRADLPKLSLPINLQASGDTTKPVIMYVPDTVKNIEWVQYDNATITQTNRNMQNVYFVPFKDFMERSNSLDVSLSTVDSLTLTQDGNSFVIQYLNNKSPEYYTSYDEHTLIFDSYDSAVDTTLMSSKSLAYGKKVATFSMSDAFEPDMDEQQFQLLLSEAKALAWAELKQTTHAKAEMSSRRGWTSLQNSKHNSEHVTDFDALPNFGRKR